MKILIAFSMVLALLAGCGNKTEPTTATPAPPMASPPVVVTPPTPAPDAVSDGVQRPAPGQANGHSSPAFKSGGKDVPEK